MSAALYNGKTGQMVCCPLSTGIKGYPFEVRTQVDRQEGVVLCDQLKSLDWKIRQARKKGAVSDPVLRQVRARIKALLVIK